MAEVLARAIAEVLVQWLRETKKIITENFFTTAEVLSQPILLYCIL